MRILKKIFFLLIMAVITLSGFSQISRTEVSAHDQESILFITDNLPADIGTFRYIIIDQAMMSDALKESLRGALLNQAKIIIAGDINRNDVRKYFGLQQKDYYTESSKPGEDNLQSDRLVDVSRFVSVGKLICQDAAGINITDIKVEDPSCVDRVFDVFMYCFKYDYFKLSTSEDASAIESYSYSWSNVDLDTSTYGTARCTINTSIRIDRNDGNPNSDDEYLSHIGYAVDTDMIPGWYLDQTDVEVHGRATSLVYAYGPANMTNPSNAPITFALPFSLNVSFTPGPARVNIQKIAGGIDSNNFKTRFNTVTIFGTDGLTSNMLAETDIESYQPSSGYFFGYGQFYATTYAYNWKNPLTYYNSSGDVISGS